MTQDEWFRESNWERHLAYLGDRISPRKQRLLAAGFCRLLWDVIEDAVVREAIETAEHAVEGRASVAQLEHVRKRCRELASQCEADASRLVDRGYEDASSRYQFRCDLAWLGAFVTAGQFRIQEIGTRTQQATEKAAMQLGRTPPGSQEMIDEIPAARAHHTREQCEILHDLIGNPFCPIVFPPSWRTSTVLAIASPMLETGDFTTLPILADALEDAGCEEEQVLAHCRKDGTHYRGCWVVDGILGKV